MLAALFSGGAVLAGALSLAKGNKSKLVLPLMLVSFIFQLVFLTIRGEERGACPLEDAGEICLFLAWSLTIFYLLIGSSYRVSLLGFFTAPVVLLLTIVPIIPGVLDVDVVRTTTTDYWAEMHKAFSVLSYGALALACISATMYLVLNKNLKTQNTQTGIFSAIASVQTLLNSTIKLNIIGLLFLTVGMLSAFYMPYHGGLHFWIPIIVWLAYLILLAIYFTRGLSPKHMAAATIIIFLTSLVIFATI